MTPSGNNWRRRRSLQDQENPPVTPYEKLQKHAVPSLLEGILYMEANCTWIPAKELTHAKELVEQFKAMQKAAQKSKEGIRALQEQGKPKEGILSWTKSTPSRNPVQTPTSPTRTTPKPSYSQMAI